MAKNNLKKYFVLLALLGLSIGLSIAQEQPEFDNQEMMPPPEFEEGSDMERMGPPPGFDENASGTMHMRRPPMGRPPIGGRPPQRD